MTYTFTDFVGNVGVFLILASYLALQAEKVSASSMLYSALNALGAGLVLISLFFNFNLSAFIIEFFWLIISAYGIAKSWMRRHA